jgi:hypothetical protein
MYAAAERRSSTSCGLGAAWQTGSRGGVRSPTSERCGSSHGASVNSMEQLGRIGASAASHPPANRAVKPTCCPILVPRLGVIPAGQPDQSQPRRRNSNTKMTPTMSISASTAG